MGNNAISVRCTCQQTKRKVWSAIRWTDAMCGIGTYRARNRTHHCSIPSTQQSSIKSVCKSGDTLFGKLRPYLRKYAFVKKDMVCSSEIWSLVPSEVIIPEYQGVDKVRRLENLFRSIQKHSWIRMYWTQKGDSRPLSALSPCNSIHRRQLCLQDAGRG